MKIAHVSLRFDAPGGVETNVLEVTKGLRAAGEDARVFASDLYDEGRWERRAAWAPERDGVPVRRFPVHKRVVPFVTMPMMVGLVDALAAEPPDVLHAHSHRYGHVLECAAVARRRKIPFVVSTHYHPADRRERPVKRMLLRGQDVLFGTTAYRHADALVVETQVEGRLLREFAPGDRIHVIPPGVDLARWEAPLAPAPGPLPDRFALFAGRIAPNKGLAFLFRAFARVPPNERLPLVLLGADWGERPGLERLGKELGIEGSVQWLGHLPSRDAYEAVVRRATVLVLPSEWEAYGLVLLEAMAAGVPIVASAVGGVPEVLDGGRAGRLVPYDDDERLAAELARLFTNDKERASLVAAGHERVRGLTWQAAVERHRALYRAIVRTGN